MADYTSWPLLLKIALIIRNQDVLKHSPSILRINYVARHMEVSDIVTPAQVKQYHRLRKKRLRHLRQLIQQYWREQECCQRLIIEEDTVYLKQPVIRRAGEAK